MMSQSLRSSVSFLSRAVRQQSPIVRRSFATTPIRRADPVQDLYIRELAAYKPAPRKANDADAHVQKFVAPSPPPSPEESNISADLKAYETQAVEVEGQGQEAGEPTPIEEDWLEMDEEKPAAH
ncbi:ATP synthase H chain [Microsporum canis CBS 113480]|uniref:ATP synthase H chain n=1 Tax=Arthroderma otae (strain ATCC MYA-4605 / CBS 113480) TaxID=554155 RepID=C5FDC4_ARTOC|nr:ATP synthase H chain [Microsporum canis CBS 113480]EEQ27898.1 ATP synthase H chain [Microsporum canis CBS 113480]